VVERLAESPAVVSELAEPFSIALPSLMQHLRVLEDAGVVTSDKHGRVRTVTLRPGALDVLHVWLGGSQVTRGNRDDGAGPELGAAPLLGSWLREHPPGASDSATAAPDASRKPGPRSGSAGRTMGVTMEDHSRSPRSPGSPHSAVGSSAGGGNEG